MKRLIKDIVVSLTWVTCLGLSVGVKAQPNAAAGSRIGKWDNQIILTDLQGRPIKSQYRDVSGSPYFVDSFLTASLKMRNGRVFPEVRVKLDVVSSELLLKSVGGEEGMLRPDFLSEIRFRDSTQENNPWILIRTGYPDLHLRQPNAFYQVISDGEIQLLKSIAKFIDTRKNELSGEVSKDFAGLVEYYVFANNRIERLKREKSAVLAFMGKEAGKMSDWMNQHKGNFKNEDYLIEIFGHFNQISSTKGK